MTTTPPASPSHAASYVTMIGPELPQTSEALDKIITTLRTRGTHVPEALLAASDAVRIAADHRNKLEAQYDGLPSEARERILLLLDQCVRISLCQQPIHTDLLYANYIVELQQQRILQSDETTGWFLRVCIDAVVDLTRTAPAPVADPSLGPNQRPLHFQAMDGMLAQLCSQAPPHKGADIALNRHVPMQRSRG